MTGRASVAAGAFFALFLTFVSVFLNRGFPPVNTDEAILANHAVNLYQGNTNRYSLYDDLFDREFYVWRNAAAGVLQIVYEAWIGPFIMMPGKSLAHARRASMVAGFLTLLLWYLIACRLGGPPAGFAASIIGWATPTFQLSINLLRAEIVLLMAASFLIYLCVALPDKMRWKYLLIGILGGLSVGIHQNAVPFMAGLAAFVVARPSEIALKRRLMKLVAGALLGYMAIFCSIDVVSFWRSQQFIVFDLYRPPLLSWPWKPWQWVLKWVSLTFTGAPTWYLPGNAFREWPMAVAFGWAGALLPLLFFLKKKKRAPMLFAYFFGTAALFIALCMLIKKTEALYAVIFLPFLVPALGAALATGLRDKNAFSLAAVALLAASVISFGRFRSHYRALYPPYDRMMAEIHAAIPPGARVAGPNILWFDFPELTFRDTSALVGSRWITGRNDVKTWLEGWKPDVLVVEPTWKNMLLGRDGDTLSLLQTHLGRSVTPLAAVETGRAIVGKLEIFRLEWPDDEL